MKTIIGSLLISLLLVCTPAKSQEGVFGLPVKIQKATTCLVAVNHTVVLDAGLVKSIMFVENYEGNPTTIFDTPTTKYYVRGNHVVSFMNRALLCK